MLNASDSSSVVGWKQEPKYQSAAGPQYLTYSTLRTNGGEVYGAQRKAIRRMQDKRGQETSWQSSFGVVGKPAGGEKVSLVS